MLSRTCARAGLRSCLLLEQSVSPILSSSASISLTCQRTAVSKPSKIKGGEQMINYDERIVNIVPGINEPNYLKFLKPQVPFYELLNVQMKGYDHALLDEFADFVVRMTRKLNITVTSRWITPNESFKFDNLKPESLVVENSNVVHVYERNVQVKHVPAHLLSVYIELVQKSRPKGVTLSIHPHSEEHETIRYIPDSQLAALKAELKEWQQPLAIVAERKKI